MPRLVAALRLEVLDLSDNALSIDDLAKDNVFLVQVRRLDGRYEELRTVGTLAC